jgi:Fe-S oxidoreductase
MEHEEILHRCFRCGYCKLPGNYVDLNCPAYLSFRFETYSPGGRMWLLRAWLDKKISASQRFSEIMFSCATCGNCVEHCAFPEFRDRLLLAFTAGKEAFLDAGQIPPTVRDYLTKMQLHGNAYGNSAKKSTQWLDGLEVEDFNDQEYLFFTDDVGNFDPRGREIACSVVRLLQKAKISFGVIFEKLNSEGNDVKAIGEIPLFEEMAEKNIQVLNNRKVKKIITLSPHSFNALKNDYPALGGRYQVFHYTQVLAFAMGRLNFSQNAEKLFIAFHDPCYLGRHNMDYESARMILRSIMGATLVEMDRNRKNALCCGGGGGNFFTNILSGGDDPSARARVREAVEAGAQILAVACPMCAVMLEDAVKTENLDGKIQVQEVSEIVNQLIL